MAIYYYHCGKCAVEGYPCDYCAEYVRVKYGCITRDEHERREAEDKASEAVAEKMRKQWDAIDRQNALERSWGRGTNNYHPGITTKELMAMTDPDPNDLDDCKDYMAAHPNPEEWPAWLRGDGR